MEKLVCIVLLMMAVTICGTGAAIVYATIKRWDEPNDLVTICFGMLIFFAGLLFGACSIHFGCFSS